MPRLLVLDLERERTNTPIGGNSKEQRQTGVFAACCVAPRYLAEVGSVDLGLRDLGPLRRDGVVVLLVHPFLLVQTLQRQGKGPAFKDAFFCLFLF